MEQHHGRHAAAAAVVQPGDDDLERDDVAKDVEPRQGSARQQGNMPDGAQHSHDERGDEQPVFLGSEPLLEFWQGITGKPRFFPQAAEQQQLQPDGRDWQTWEWGHRSAEDPVQPKCRKQRGGNQRRTDEVPPARAPLGQARPPFAQARSALADCQDDERGQRRPVGEKRATHHRNRPPAQQVGQQEEQDKRVSREQVALLLQNNLRSNMDLNRKEQRWPRESRHLPALLDKW